MNFIFIAGATGWWRLEDSGGPALAPLWTQRPITAQRLRVAGP